MESIEIAGYKFICFTDAGRDLMVRMGKELAVGFKEDFSSPKSQQVESLKDWTHSVFKKGNILVFIGAVGIAVRAIVPFVEDKTKDPGVVVIDEQGNFAIPILSGHLGGAVDAAKRLSGIIGATAVITTATDTRGEFSVDVFAKRNDLAINDMKKAKEFTASLLKTGYGYYFIDSDFSWEISVDEMPYNITPSDSEKSPIFRISPRSDSRELSLIPKCLVVGIGCKKGKTCDELKDFLFRNLQKENLDIKAVKAICSIDLKKDEPGLTKLCEELELPFYTYAADVLKKQDGDFSSSQFVKGITGTDNVCERSVIAYGCKRLLLKKTSENGMTIAIGVLNLILK